jgi:hypothetical protein
LICLFCLVMALLCRLQHWQQMDDYESGALIQCQLTGRVKYFLKNVSTYHFIHHIFHT